MATKLEPFNISLVANRYFIHDVDVITFARREHHICGVLLGSIPQIPQQNVFLGAPLELMPEEARLLLGKEAAILTDDLRWHKTALSLLPACERQNYLLALHDQGVAAGRGVLQRTEERKNKALEKLRRQNSPQSVEPTESLSPGYEGRAKSHSSGNGVIATSKEPALVFKVTPSTSGRMLAAVDHKPVSISPKLPLSYPLYEFLHEKGYFISPGLRFGCQYLVYPGDPLRFHSHFLAVSASWDEEMDLLDIVGGGRLGTGVKKGFLIGGLESENPIDVNFGFKTCLRTFCVEWGGM